MNGNSVLTKFLVGIAVAAALAAAGTWAQTDRNTTAINAHGIRCSETREKVEELEEDEHETAKQLEVVAKTNDAAHKRIVDDVDALKTQQALNQRENARKLDELLRRSR